MNPALALAAAHVAARNPRLPSSLAGRDPAVSRVTSLPLAAPAVATVASGVSGFRRL